jgi:hypothetical protein
MAESRRALTTFLSLSLLLGILIYPTASADPPCLPSPVIEKIVWAPADTVVYLGIKVEP